METPKEYYYTYYSYEEYGRGYIGSRGCKCLPEEDIKYFGSFKDKTFKPTQKIILKFDYATREEAYKDEIILHNYYDVENNPHFANKAKATSTGFYYVPSKEQSSELGKKYGKLGGKKAKELGLGFFGRSEEKMSEDGRLAGKIGGKKAKELGIGIHGLTDEQRRENSKKGGKIGGKISGKLQYELGLGIHGLTVEQKKEISKKSGKICYDLKLGAHGRTKDQIIRDGRKGGKISANQKWECTETGYVANAGNLSQYQKRNGIDTSKRRRIL